MKILRHFLSFLSRFCLGWLIICKMDITFHEFVCFPGHGERQSPEFQKEEPKKIAESGLEPTRGVQ